MNIVGARVLVTGASSGIGAELVPLLRAGGAEVIASGRNAATLTGDENIPVDLTESGSCAWLAEAAGKVDVFIGNAGIGYAGEFAKMPVERITELIDVNQTANMILTRMLLPGMLERGHGFLAFIGSIAGSMAVADEAAYSGSKAGMAAFAESIRLAVRPQGVGVARIVPGVVDTPFFARRGTEYERTRPRPVPAQRVAKAAIHAIEANRVEVFVPAWLRFPARLHGAAPGLVRRLREHFE